MTDEPARRPHGLTGFLLDFGPLLAFFLAYKFSGIIVSTAVFMAAILIALAVSYARYRRASPMMWISAILVIGFGGLTIWLRDERFIQMKPTIIYAGFALLLGGGVLAGKPLLRHLFGPIFDGLSEAGWMKLSRNWALFFAFMAVLNEALRATLSFEAWLTAKVWGVTALSVAFALANMPMLMRHGFAVDQAKDEPPIPPASL